MEPTLAREGAFAPNTLLDGAVRLFENTFTGPESVASRGRDNEIFVSMHGGSIVRVFGSEFQHYKEVAKIGPGCSKTTYTLITFNYFNVLNTNNCLSCSPQGP